MDKKLNKIKVIIPFYNPGRFIDMCINSVLTQDYENYEVLFIDDCSTDGSYKKIPDCKYKVNATNDGFELDEEGNPIIEYKHPLLDRTKCTNVMAWRSSERLSALPNLHSGITKFATDPDDIVVILDGDDWLFGKSTLSYINDYYNEHDCWMMYGSSRWTDGRKCCSSAYTPEEFRKLRRTHFRVSHIRTFRAGLYHSIGKQDEFYDCMKDGDGKWYSCTYDVAMFIPMLELAGYDKVKHNEKPLYIYNRDNPISDDKVRQQLQWDIHAEILEKKPFKKIESYK